MRRFVPLLVTAMVLAFANPTRPAEAAPTDCTIIDMKLICGHQVETPGSPGRSNGVSATHDADREEAREPTAQWVTLGPVQVAGRCDYGGPNERPMLGRSLISPTGETLRTIYSCAEDPEPATPELPPAPPTTEEVLASAPIPRPVINRNPSGRGLTGLESWFWAEDPGMVNASVALRGWLVTGSLSSGQWVWETGDGGRHVSNGPGSADHPAARHTYEAKGTWPVSVHVSWSGSYTVAGYGTSYTVDGLTTEGTATIDYQVIEVRAVLDEQVQG